MVSLVISKSASVYTAMATDSYFYVPFSVGNHLMTPAPALEALEFWTIQHYMSRVFKVVAGYFCLQRKVAFRTPLVAVPAMRFAITVAILASSTANTSSLPARFYIIPAA